jgi:hypothetical protein
MIPSQWLPSGFYIWGSPDSGHALTIPSAYLHATLTIKGGFLVTKDFATRYTIQSFSRYLAWGLQQELDENSRANCYYLYLDCLNVALEKDLGPDSKNPVLFASLMLHI